MFNDEVKKKAHLLRVIAQERGEIIQYSDFCKTEEAKEYALTKEEIDSNWDKLCNECFELIQKANMTNEEIDRISNKLIKS